MKRIDLGGCNCCSGGPNRPTRAWWKRQGRKEIDSDMPGEVVSDAIRERIRQLKSGEVIAVEIDLDALTEQTQEEKDWQNFGLQQAYREPEEK